MRAATLRPVARASCLNWRSIVSGSLTVIPFIIVHQGNSILSERQHRGIRAGFCTCGDAAINSPRKVLKSSPWAPFISPNLNDLLNPKKRRLLTFWCSVSMKSPCSDSWERWPGGGSPRHSAAIAIGLAGGPTKKSQGVYGAHQGAAARSNVRDVRWVSFRLLRPSSIKRLPNGGATQMPNCA